MPFKLALLMTAHERPRLTKFVQAYYHSLDIEGVELEQFVVCSSLKDVSDVARRWVRPNKSLSRRWNEVCERARPYKPDAVVVVGSDDLLSADCIRLTARLLKDYPIVIPERCHVYDAETQRLAYLTGARCVGCGRAFRADVLDRFDWRLWHDEPPVKDERSLAWMPVAAQMKRMGTALDAAITYSPARRKVAIVDIKTEEGNLNSYDELLARTDGYKRERAAPFLDRHFPSVADELLNWNEAAV